jgi:nucleoside-diphosphate-sugar epimerase
VGTRVIVTGAQGFLGRHLTATLLDAGAEAVLGLGRSPRTDDRYTHDLAWLDTRLPAPLPPELRPTATDRRYRYATIDLRDAAGLAMAVRDFGPDVIFHLAAALRDEPWDRLIASNIQATVSLMRATEMPSPPRVVLVSSGSVYGAGGGHAPFAETGPAEPRDPYGATKRAAEDVARVCALRSGTPLVIGRVFNLVGPGLDDRHLPGALAGRISAIRRRLAPPTLTLGPLDSTRDFVDVRDAAGALVALARAGDPGTIVNVASGIERPAREVLDVLLHLAGDPPVEIEWTTARPADIPRSVADVGRLTALGFTAGTPLHETLGRMLAYFDAFPPG